MTKSTAYSLIALSATAIMLSACGTGRALSANDPNVSCVSGMSMAMPVCHVMKEGEIKNKSQVTRTF